MSSLIILFGWIHVEILKIHVTNNMFAGHLKIFKDMSWNQGVSAHHSSLFSAAKGLTMEKYGSFLKMEMTLSLLEILFQGVMNTTVLAKLCLPNMGRCHGIMGPVLKKKRIQNNKQKSILFYFLLYIVNYNVQYYNVFMDWNSYRLWGPKNP